MNRFDWVGFVFAVSSIVCVTMAVLDIGMFSDGPSEPQHTCPLPATTPSPGPVTVEWTHGDGTVTVQLGGAGYPIVMDPGANRRWIVLPVKED